VNLSWSGIDNAIRLAIRLMLLVMGPSILTLTTTPIELTDGIESLLKPLTFIRFPVHSLAMIMSMALRLIPPIMEETDKIILAQKARCADFDSRNPFKKLNAMLPILIPLFVSGIRRADELAFAMDSRCYRGAKGRTKYKKLHTSVGDVFALIGLCVLFFGILLLCYNWWGWAWITVAVTGVV
ncbi:MAG: energy-coupling factor transporter transmembrane protein EcfT, partial [Clostridia bacterium]|nr:energy-coupling factor transporter transmembrane protein EcfT [Clostridia bacterium]